MITQLNGLPDGVIGFEISGKLHAEDYRDALLPAIEHAAANGKLRVVIVITSFDGLTPSALWRDLKMGTEHLRSWQRIALVTDVEWISHLMTLFGWMTPGQAKQFTLAQRADAIEWAAG